MCIVAVAYKVHADYKLVLAANRDEKKERASLPMHWLEEHPGVLSGIDEESGGTWMGITRTGRLACITNFRIPKPRDNSLRSRGFIVKDYLIGCIEPSEFLETLSNASVLYNPFSIIFGYPDDLYYFSSPVSEGTTISKGIHVLSNTYLDAPWPKSERMKAVMEYGLMFSGNELIRLLLSALQDRVPALDVLLPHTGVERALERLLSPVFVNAPGYGTVSSTLLLVDWYNNVTVLYIKYESPSVRSFFRFRIERSKSI